VMNNSDEKWWRAMRCSSPVNITTSHHQFPSFGSSPVTGHGSLVTAFMLWLNFLSSYVNYKLRGPAWAPFWHPFLGETS
jgi:hypothetical protein